MAIFDIGRVCIKLAGRDANKKCVVVDVKDGHTVVIDGETRRRQCNVKHLEPLSYTLNIKKGASSADVASAFKPLGVTMAERKPKKAAAKPKTVRKVKERPVEEAKPKKAAPKASKVEKKE